MTDQTDNQGYMNPQFVTRNDIPSTASVETQDNKPFATLPNGQVLIPIQTTNGIIYVPVQKESQGISNQVPFNFPYAPIGFNQPPAPQTQGGNSFLAGIGKFICSEGPAEIKGTWLSMDEPRRYEFILKAVSFFTVIFLGVVCLIDFFNFGLFLYSINFIVAIMGLSAFKRQNLKDFKKYIIFQFAVFITNLNSLLRVPGSLGLVFCVLLSLVSGYLVKRGHWLRKNVLNTVWKANDLDKNDPEAHLTKS